MTDIDKFDYVRFCVADLHGRSKGRLVPARHVRKYLENGPVLNGDFLSYNLQNVKVPISESDPHCRRVPKAIAVPDFTTLHEVPWLKGENMSIGEVICDSYWITHKSYQQACPRYVARKQLEELSKRGFSLLSGFEVEFILCHNKEYHANLERKHNFLKHDALTKQRKFLLDLEKSMSAIGFDTDSIYVEEGPCMFEFVQIPSYGMHSVDSLFTFKAGSLEMAQERDFFLTFKSKTGYGPIGTHLGHSLWSSDSKTNIFHDSNREYSLSQVGSWWLAGVMKHAKALTALWCPTVNCYERLLQTNLPGSIFWGVEQRSAMVRVRKSDKGIYLENRIPSGMSNPYLVLAATVAAGLDGIEKKLHLPPEGECSVTEPLPCSLEEAIQELQSDFDIVDSLGEEFVDWFVRTMKADIEDARCNSSGNDITFQAAKL